jgi:nicotinate-nucleotide adenylyltransferase
VSRSTPQPPSMGGSPAPAVSRTGLLGGSFDPIHRGHLELALAARDALGLDRVVLLPTALPPHKPGARLAPAHARYAMAELAVLDHADLQVSAFELTPGRPAYTIDTLAHFAAEEPGAERYLLVGSDSLPAFDRWRDWERILDECRLAVVERPGSSREAVLAAAAPSLAGRLAEARVEWVEHEPHPASATEIRRRLAAGADLPEGWLDPRVVKFIRKYGLYR